MSRFYSENEEQQLRENGIHYEYTEALDHKPVIRLFSENSIYLLTELSPFFKYKAWGLVDTGTGPRLEWIDLTPIENDLTITRDDNFTAKHTLGAYENAAMFYGDICEGEVVLDCAEWYYKTLKGLEPL